MSLIDPKLDTLISLIRDSFRVRENHDPVYVDISGHFKRIEAPQQQVIFGRRGSGKSCLLVHFHRVPKNSRAMLSVYVDTDEVKRLTYPDLLVRLLITIFSKLPGIRRRGLTGLSTALNKRRSRLIQDLTGLLDQAESATIREKRSSGEQKSMTARLTSDAVGVEGGRNRHTSTGRLSAFTERKIDHIERHLQDYKNLLRECIGTSKADNIALLIDDFYLIRTPDQPDVIDYLHRLVRGTNAYLKVATVRHRTSLVRHEGQTIGVELYQDVEPIDLDHTLEDIFATKDYLAQMLDSLGANGAIEKASETYFNPDALFALTLASGGVPRDYLTIFVEAVEAARAGKTTKWLTPTHVYKGAARLGYRTKLQNLRSDVGADASSLERLFVDLTKFCLQEKRKTVFLISQDEARSNKEMHDVIKQFMDFKLIHVIEPDTSAASGRSGRYEAYTLDPAFYMEPRRRNIDIVGFWEVDASHRKRGVREAPVYSLQRARDVFSNDEPIDTEFQLNEIQKETVDEDTAETGDCKQEEQSILQRRLNFQDGEMEE